MSRPGFHTSEFLIAALNLVVQVILALQGTVSDQTATKYGVAGAIAYIISRGLAKYEHRTTTTTPTPPVPPA